MFTIVAKYTAYDSGVARDDLTTSLTSREAIVHHTNMPSL